MERLGRGLVGQYLVCSAAHAASAATDVVDRTDRRAPDADYEADRECLGLDPFFVRNPPSGR